MFDTFLKVAYEKTAAARSQDQLIHLMKEKLSSEQLLGIATGEKTALSGCIDGSGVEWIDKFKGTPFFEQAVQLEQESMQLEVAEKQQREMSQGMWDARDQLHLKKRLLSLQMAMSEQKALSGGPSPAAAPPAAAPPPPAGEAPPPGPSPAGEAGGMTPKSVSVKLGSVQTAFQWGREFAHKLAFDPQALLSMGKGLGSKALQYAKANPAVATGVLTGAAGGLLSGGQADERGHHSVGRALKGAVMGGAVGGLGAHAAQGVGQAMQGGTPFAQAVGGYAKNVGGALKARAGQALQGAGEALHPPGVV